LYAVHTMSTVKEGFDYPKYNGERQVFVFEDYTIKRAYREVEAVKENGTNEQTEK